MNLAVVTTLAVLITAWALLSGALARRNLTGPMLFVLAGFVIGNPDWGPLPVDAAATSVQVIAEITLALLLFSDASRISLGELRREASIPARLLGIGLPLTIVLGTATAVVVITDLPWALALFIGAALAPTDAALSAAVITNPRVPMRLRRSLNVESGLNDGIATPLVTVALVVSATALGLTDEPESIAFSEALRELGIGALAGLAVGAMGAWATNQATRRGWTTAGARQMAALGLAVGAYALALAGEGNGFIAAFVAGLVFSGIADKDMVDTETVVVLPELGGELLALVVWFLFGAGLLPIILANLDLATVTVALLSLTVLRMLPVAVAMIGAGLPRRDVMFLAWFGPRGLASVVFALLAVEELAEAEQPLVGQAIAVVGLTVMLSVILHGATAAPAAQRFDPTRVQHTSAAEEPAARPQQLSSTGDSPPGLRLGRPDTGTGASGDAGRAT